MLSRLKVTRKGFNSLTGSLNEKQRKFFYGNKLIQIFFFVKKLDFYVVFVVEAEHVAAGCLVVLQTADRRQHWARALVLQPNPLGIYIQYGGPAQG